MRKGRLVIAVGAAGGATIPVQSQRALIGVIDFGCRSTRRSRCRAVRARRRADVEQGSALEAMIPQLQAPATRKVSAARASRLKTNGAQRTDSGWTGAGRPAQRRALPFGE
jgi:gamma-glutamyltranspeptidase/glutathione hydrolase